MPDDPAHAASRVFIFPIGEAALDVTAVEREVEDPGLGSRCTFIGTVRNESFGEPASHLEYEAYPSMAIRELRRIGEQAVLRWPQARVAVAHRIGRLELEEASVVVAVAAETSDDAIAACTMVIDELKVRVPIWKKEFGPDGGFWVEGPGEHRSAARRASRS
jgi:molybdopterin synthase catalytic subunit